MKYGILVTSAMVMGLALSVNAGEPEVRESQVGKVAMAAASALVKLQFAPFGSLDRLDTKYSLSERLGMVGPGDICKEHYRFDGVEEGYECYKEGDPDKIYRVSTANYIFSRALTTTFGLYGTYKWWQLEYMMLVSLGLV